MPLYTRHLTVGDLRQFVDAGANPTRDDELLYVMDDRGRRRAVVRLGRHYGSDVVMSMGGEAEEESPGEPPRAA